MQGRLRRLHIAATESRYLGYKDSALADPQPPPDTPGGTVKRMGMMSKASRESAMAPICLTNSEALLPAAASLCPNATGAVAAPISQVFLTAVRTMPMPQSAFWLLRLPYSSLCPEERMALWPALPLLSSWQTS